MKLLFLTGTRADWGKIKPLIAEAQTSHDVTIFATGMHMLSRYGLTVREIERSGYVAYPFINQDGTTPIDAVLANTVTGLSLYVRENRPDLLVVHGDRVEALAGAIVGAFNGILTAHIEGGERSGTIDGSIRHSVTKLAHAHFCANKDAADRLRRMGESSVFEIGSPDVDAMLADLPSIEQVRERYEIWDGDYGIYCYHPVAGEDPRNAAASLRAVMEDDIPYVAIYPNNDPGSDVIIDLLDGVAGQMRVIPSMRFEHFLALLKGAQVIVGNSSAGIREAPVYGVKTVNVGTRQAGRAILPSIEHVADNTRAVADALTDKRRYPQSLEFGRGDSARRFADILATSDFWRLPTSKTFRD